MKGNVYNVGFRRKREGRTDYSRRRKLLLIGKPRLVIRKSLKNIICQIIEYASKGDKVLVSASSKNLEKFGWKGNKGNVPSAYLTGFLLGAKAKSKVKELIVDLGLSYGIKGSREYAALKGAVDGGLNIRCSPKIFPSEERIKGTHINENLTKIFDDVKSNIIKVKE